MWGGARAQSPCPSRSFLGGQSCSISIIWSLGSYFGPCNPFSMQQPEIYLKCKLELQSSSAKNPWKASRCTWNKIQTLQRPAVPTPPLSLYLPVLCLPIQPHLALLLGVPEHSFVFAAPSPGGFLTHQRPLRICPRTCSQITTYCLFHRVSALPPFINERVYIEDGRRGGSVFVHPLTGC